MTVSVIFRPAAESELQEGHHWYEEREAGLGLEFMRCVDACVQLIRRHPEIFPVTYKNVRQAVVRRFPYSIFYLASNEKITVISVFHASRDPKIWQRRARFQ
jgi:toxin ParE1/3/4